MPLWVEAITKQKIAPTISSFSGPGPISPVIVRGFIPLLSVGRCPLRT